ncbi:hypothetical protein P171DRAFT_495823 [Karstenula rhodostoma CBS 690.94]|uniref:Uncharacterized protein n=1 Tax=Karstenula rhodostoma CBS 690.94 TaxID=1392251 RepID=A0A9P4UAV2_9PLEO|nr:hypothetical protein P171DRAFT_495823 [Karstenula rhodostoma CBS 690.94]
MRRWGAYVLGAYTLILKTLKVQSWVDVSWWIATTFSTSPHCSRSHEVVFLLAQPLHPSLSFRASYSQSRELEPRNPSLLTHLELGSFRNTSWRANGQPVDALSHQQQAVLRATPSPASLLADWTKPYWFSRRTTRNTLSRSLLQATLALLFAVGAIMARVSSSFVVDSTNLRVLVQSSNCGPLDMEAPIDFPYAKPYASNVISRSVPFASDRYPTSNAS